MLFKVINMCLFMKVKKLCEERGISIAELERKLGLSPNVLYKLKTQKPSIDRVQSLADFFNVSVDYLLGRSEIPYIVDQVETIAAHHDSDEWTKEELEEIEEFKRFVALRREARKNKGE